MPRHHLQSRLPAPVPVGMIHALNRRTRHQERFQNSVLHHRHGPGLDAFIVVRVVTVQIDAAKRFARRIEYHGQETRQNRRAHRLGESLSLAFVLLAMSFDAMAENLMEEYRGRASGKDGRANERLHRRRLHQFGQIFAHAVGRGINHGLRWQMRQIGRLKILQRHQVHAVRSLAARHDGKARKVAPVQQPRCPRC